MNAVSVDVMNLLDADPGLGLTIGTDLFAMEWGESANKQILIIDTGGINSPLKDLYEQPTFQVLSRGGRKADMNTAYQQARAVHEFLITQPTALNLMGFEPTGGPPELIGRDDNDRAIYSCNYYTFRNPI